MKLFSLNCLIARTIKMITESWVYFSNCFFFFSRKDCSAKWTWLRQSGAVNALNVNKAMAWGLQQHFDERKKWKDGGCNAPAVICHHSGSCWTHRRELEKRCTVLLNNAWKDQNLLHEMIEWWKLRKYNIRLVSKFK